MESLITNPRIDAFLRAGRIEEALAEPVKSRGASTGGVAAFIRWGTAPYVTRENLAMASLTLGDFLYDFVRINPDVVRAVEFSRSSGVNSVLSFAHFADAKADLAGASLDGLYSDLQGYVAEQVVAHHLVGQGHDVVFPSTPNNPGWDIKVDGHPFQIKCLADHQGVLDHLHRYPNIPVIVNSELAGQVGSMDGVYVDSELHHDTVRSVTEDSLHHGQGMADLEIPWISLGISGAFNFSYMVKNHTDVASMLVNTATDTGGRAVGGGVGKYVGSTAGLVLFGPAGAIVVGLAGAISGSMLGRRAAAAGRSLLVQDEEKAVRRAAQEVAGVAASSMLMKLRVWEEKLQIVRQSLSGGRTNQQAVRDVLKSRMIGQIAYWKAKHSDLARFSEASLEGCVTLVDRLLLLIRRAGVHPHHIQGPLKDLSQKLERLRAAMIRFRVA